MTPHPFLRWLSWMALGASLLAGFTPPRSADRPPTSPLSAVPLTVAPVGWSAIERRVLRGVRRGVACFRFGVADRDDVIAVAMERAWRSFGEAVEEVRDPEAWGRTIAVRVGLDELRRTRRDRVHLTGSGAPTDAVERHPTCLASPLDAAVRAERSALLRQRVEGWPAAERQLALLLMEGQAETVTAAARLYRAQQEARGEPGTMYPLKARVLLDARRQELEDLA